MCRRLVGIALLFWGLVNVGLFIKFTPVYSATECGDQTATLERFSVGSSIEVGLRIEIWCTNPNAYDVRVAMSQPGHVFLGADRDVVLGRLTLVNGSTLPAKGIGQIFAQMDADISRSSSTHILPHLMSDSEIPLFLELQFDVRVGITIGPRKFGTSAPFKKKCGMMLAGVLVNTDKRLGPLLCRDSYDELNGTLPGPGEATKGSMSFTAAQMDPERVRLGELIKNISIIGIGTLCFVFGVWFTFLDKGTNPWATVRTYGGQAEGGLHPAERMRSAFAQAVNALPRMPTRSVAVNPAAQADTYSSRASSSLMGFLSCCRTRLTQPHPASTATGMNEMPPGTPSRWRGILGAEPAPEGQQIALLQPKPV